MSKLKLDFEYDYEFFLVGIHTTLEDYLLAFYINNFFEIKLRRNYKMLSFKNKKGAFSIYDCDNPTNFSFWSLISNRQVIEEKTITPSLFDTIYSTYILINEKKNIDFFLKIDGDFTTQEKQNILQKLTKIDGIIACEEIEAKKLKSINNLIY